MSIQPPNDNPASLADALAPILPEAPTTPDAQSAPQNKPTIFRNSIPLDSEQKEIVEACQKLKSAFQQHGSEKKRIMRTSYAYSKSKHEDGDLLPMPSVAGSERDNNSARPQVFIPLVRQQLKQIYAQVKLTIFPNDESYMRIRARTAEGMMLEDELTEAVQYKFKEAKLSEKAGACLYNLIWSGCFIANPVMADRSNTEWSWIDPLFDEFGNPVQEGYYESKPIDIDPLLDVQAFNPLHFYIDPTVSDFDFAKWGYFTQKSTQDILDSPLYFNKDKLLDDAKTEVDSQPSNNDRSLNDLNGLQKTFMDIEEHTRFDLFYFPMLKIKSRPEPYRNILVAVADSRTLIRFHPNLLPRGMNPLVFANWMAEPDNPYSTSPVEDLIDIQKTINILWNYKLEVLSRAGNRFAVRPNVDMANLFGVAGGVAVTDDPKNDIVNFSGDYSEIATIDNSIGVLKAEGTQVAGSSNPFQGSSNIDFKKTATELQMLQENSITILRENIEHIGIMGVERLLNRGALLLADNYKTPIQIPVNDPVNGRTFKMVDLSVLKSGQFTVELVSINASQSKQAQKNTLMQLFQLVSQNPEALFVGGPALEKIGELDGIKNIKDLLDQIRNNYRELQGQQQQQAALEQQQAIAAQANAQVQQEPPG